MTVEQFVAILGATTALVVAVTALLLQMRTLTHHVNGRLDELLSLREESARREGELKGRDFAMRPWQGGSQPPSSSSSSSS